MNLLSRRELLLSALATSAGLTFAQDAGAADVHRQLLDLARRLESERRARFAAVRTKAELEELQGSLRRTFLRLLGDLPAKGGVPPVAKTGRIEGDGYFVEKLAYESLPGYFVPALLYRPRGLAGPAPGVLSPCGHSAVGKAAEAYQILHINLARRGFFVLTYDPVGQGERSQFWDAEKKRSRFDLACGEHAVIGNALYLIGSSLARFRIWDGMRGIDYLASLPEVDAARIGCVGNSGGGTLTAYITALDPRVAAAAICCYITTLPRRMGNRIQQDPSADPEQDIFGFVGEGIDHAGLLALCAPRPTLLGTAQFDFFPIEGARESFAEAKRLYEVAGAVERIERAEAPEKHGLSRPLREAVYGWFGRWLGGGGPVDARESAVKPRPAEELRVCAGGQAGVTFRSRPLLPLALEEFRGREKPSRKALRDLLRLDPIPATPRTTEIGSGAGETLVLCVNGNEATDWREEREFLRAIERAGHAVSVVDPRGVGQSRPDLRVRGQDYADPLSGVEENIAYNAFLVGRSLLGLRVSDVLAAVREAVDRKGSRPIILCARRDAALVACLAAAVEPTIRGVATEEMLRSYLPLFDAQGSPINAASILPGLLRDFGDLPDVLALIAPRRVLVAAGIGEGAPNFPSVRLAEGRFTRDPRVLTDWLRG
jgi:dienelactone hydrolase/pimeloyl-ACP methyl ester carboxylesterase